MDKNEEYLKLLDKTILPSNEDSVELAKKFKKIIDFVKKDYSGSVYRYRAYNQMNISAFNNDLLFISDNNFYTDLYDSSININMESINQDLKNEFLKIDRIDLINKLKMIKHPSSTNIINNLQNYDNESLKEIIESFIPFFKPILNYKLNNYINALRKNQNRSICFCESVIDNCMWDRYANGHKGFCLEYNFIPGYIETICTKCNHKCDKELTMCLLPVAYSDKKFDATYQIKRLVISDLLLEMLKFDPYNGVVDLFFLHKIQLHKERTGYSNEKEWRLIINNSKCDVVRFPPKAVYLGAGLLRHEKDRIAFIAYKKWIIVYEMKINYYSLSFDLEKSLYKLEVPLNQISLPPVQISFTYIFRNKRILEKIESDFKIKIKGE